MTTRQAKQVVQCSNMRRDATSQGARWRHVGTACSAAIRRAQARRTAKVKAPWRRRTHVIRSRGSCGGAGRSRSRQVLAMREYDVVRRQGVEAWKEQAGSVA